MTMHGIDVSHWQTGLTLAKTDAQFAIVKASESTGYVDPACNGFVSQAKKQSMPWGTYHFYQGNPDAEADHYLATIRDYVGHGLMVLDFETHTADVAGAKRWLDRVYGKTGIRPLIYMSQSVANGHNWASVARDYALWVARYNSTIGPTGAWDSVAMWQYTSTHRTGGMAVDADYFYGTVDTWNAYTTGTTTTGDNMSNNEIANAVWNSERALWFPGDTDAGDTMPAGQQLNQARGYGVDSNERIRALAKDVAAIRKALGV